ncbi:MAG: hypothetical protein M2R45_05159 [Verrucomicrobia subdivision 3 bacterium]|nr:hypothetical protein [Limisphaerales bacterium]MCS1413802.1 hypothetical protein [Limisphaerales bacterium]
MQGSPNLPSPSVPSPYERRPLSGSGNYAAAKDSKCCKRSFETIKTKAFVSSQFSVCTLVMWQRRSMRSFEQHVGILASDIRGKALFWLRQSAYPWELAFFESVINH